MKYPRDPVAFLPNGLLSVGDTMESQKCSTPQVGRSRRQTQRLPSNGRPAGPQVHHEAAEPGERHRRQGT